MRVIPVILSGGAGTRLWPLSQSRRPKQFLDLGFGASLFAQTLKRCTGTLFDPRPIIVAAAQNRDLVEHELSMQQREADIILEPMRRDSCAAVVAGVLAARARDPECLVFVAAADHHIPDPGAFQTCIEGAVDAAEAGWIVTFGITPTEAATNYGYIRAGGLKVGNASRQVAVFKEKPDRDTAAEYVRQGFLWNSGNLLVRAQDFLGEARSLVPALVDSVERATALARYSGNAVALEAAAFASAPRISVDHAVLEKTQKAAVALTSFAWGDIGSWDAVASGACGAGSCDRDGNAVIGNSFAHGSCSVFVRSDAQLTTVVGCDDLIVVVTGDAVLVTKKGQSKKMKTMLAALEAHVTSATALEQSDCPDSPDVKRIQDLSI